MTRRDGRWAIQERWAAREWTLSDVGRRLRKEGEGPAGTRNANDPLAKLRVRLGFGYDGSRNFGNGHLLVIPDGRL